MFCILKTTFPTLHSCRGVKKNYTSSLNCTRTSTLESQYLSKYTQLLPSVLVSLTDVILQTHEACGDQTVTWCISSDIIIIHHIEIKRVIRHIKHEAGVVTWQLAHVSRLISRVRSVCSLWTCWNCNKLPHSLYILMFLTASLHFQY